MVLESPEQQAQYQFFHNYELGTISVKKYLGKRPICLVIYDGSQMHYDETNKVWLGTRTITKTLIGEDERWSEPVTARVKRGQSVSSVENSLIRMLEKSCTNL